jgi:transforming growth factor-beta-induced protein
MDIVDTAIADGRFTTLVAAVQAAGLVDTLKGAGPYTVFAPTDDAFAKLPAGALDGLLQDKQALSDVLLYHVVSGQVMAADVVKLQSADTALGQPVSIQVDGDKVMVNDAQVIITDIQTSNGVIHVIDSVLLPPQEPPTALPVTGGEAAPNMWLLAALGVALVAGGLALRFNPVAIFNRK